MTTNMERRTLAASDCLAIYGRVGAHPVVTPWHQLATFTVSFLVRCRILPNTCLDTPSVLSPIGRYCTAFTAMVAGVLFLVFFSEVIQFAVVWCGLRKVEDCVTQRYRHWIILIPYHWYNCRAVCEKGGRIYAQKNAAIFSFYAKMNAVAEAVRRSRIFTKYRELSLYATQEA
jgi:hypothetical protein